MPADQSLDIARRIKERYCYIAADMAKVCCFIHPFFCFPCCISMDSDLHCAVTSDDTTLMLHVMVKHVSCNVPCTCGLGVIHQYCCL